MFSSRWSYYFRLASFALIFLLIFRLIFNRDDVTNSDFLQPFDDNDELLKYSNVYFIESSAPFRKVVTFEARHACAIEAAARANPRKNIIVLLAAWMDFSEADHLQIPDLPALARFRNVHFRWLDLERFARGTPVERVIMSERLYERPDGVEFLSEILRMVLLYKYGGIYLDLDVVTLKTLDFYHPNFFGAQSYAFAETSVMGLQRGGYGQKFAKDYLLDIEYFHDNNELRNGSLLLTYKLLQHCEKVTVQEIVENGCFGRLEVFPRYLFHPFDDTDVEFMFDATKLAKVKAMIEPSMAVHMLHHYSRGMKGDISGETGYEMIAKGYCPSVYSDNEDSF